MHKLKPFLPGRIVLALTVVVFGLLIFFSLHSEKYKLGDLTDAKVAIKIGSVRVTAEIAETQEQLIQGLSDRTYLEENSGMYFILNERRLATFWMKNMRFPLDIIWIDKGTIIGLIKNSPIPTAGVVPSFTSPQPITHVLEVNAGFVDEHNINIGDTVAVLD